MAIAVKLVKVSTVFTTISVGTKLADIVPSGGTAPYTYSMHINADKYEIVGTEVRTKILFTIDNIAPMAVRVTDSVGLSMTSPWEYPNIQSKLLNKFTKENVIYKITKDLDLGNGVLTIPSGCLLDFLGGIIKKGTLIGSNTAIKAGVPKLFDVDLTLSGTWKVKDFYLSWYGLQANSDYTAALLKLLDTGCNVYIPEGTYKLGGVYIRHNGLLIRGAGDTTIILPTKNNVLCIIAANSTNDGSKVEVLSVVINDIMFDNSTYTGCVAIKSVYNSRSIIERCRFTGAWSTGINLTQSLYSVIRDINAENNVNGIVADGGGTFLRIEDSLIINCTGDYYIKLTDCPSTLIINTHLGANDALTTQSSGILYTINSMFPETYLLVDSCDIDSMKGTGISIINNKPLAGILSCIISNNWISCGRNGTGEGLYIKGSASIDVRNNKFYWTGNNNIKVDTSSSISITGNTLEYALDSNIRLLNSSKCLITNNVMGSMTGDPVESATAPNAIVEEGTSNFNIIVDNYLINPRGAVTVVGSNTVNNNYIHIGATNSTLLNGTTPINVDMVTTLPYDASLYKGRLIIYNGRLLYYNGDAWKDVEGTALDFKKAGTTAERPIITGVPIGYQYFDTTLGKPIWRSGDRWVDSTGTPLA